MASKIVADITYQRIVADVMVVKATSALDDSVFSSVTPTYVIPSAAVSWVYMIVDIEVDPIGRNPIVRDITVNSDSAHITFVKAPFDSSAATDDVIKAEFKKVPIDYAHTSETKAFDISTSRSDVARTNDSAFSKFVQAPRVDSFTVADSASPTMNKRPNDPVHPTDSITSRQIGKALADTPHLADIKTFVFSKKLYDTADAGDELNAQFVTDDGETMTFFKVISETFGTADAKLIAVAKSLQDAGHTAEQILRYVQKALADGAATTEAHTVAYQKFLADTADAGDELNANFVTDDGEVFLDRKSTRLNSSHTDISRMPSSA